MNTDWKCLVLGALLFAGAASARADLITDPLGVGPGANVLSFERGLDGMTVNDSAGLDTAIVVNFTAANGERVIGAPAPLGLWSLGNNGFWNTALTFGAVDGGVDVNDNVALMSFDFNGAAVQKVGGFLNFDPGFTYGGGLPLPLYIAAYGLDGTLLEDQELPISTPPDSNNVEALNQGAFYGFSRQNADIAKFVVIGPYAAVDDLTFTTPVPEPSTWALMVAGLLMAASAARRRKGVC
ncbi:MAG: PEP-CTERM sorting domain-containing protein [Rhodocyclaceae bacterium]|nr:PEP-CTERM sorting domain-containing protein [Rhodocyclaceae bacterium]MCA3133579.1 PEP-CTERM sorting domain-containing protein [Rhodocyclaceae bacterium]MCA3145844.1 PEP-CTERM sorting domain-containing protein [Rhodocyclaceae bacterium]